MGATLRHNATLFCVPACRIKAAHLPAELLDLFRAFRVQYSRYRLIIAEKPRLSDHHPVFRARIANAIHLKGSRPPLTETGDTKPAVLGGLVALEEKELQVPLLAEFILDFQTTIIHSSMWNGPAGFVNLASQCVPKAAPEFDDRETIEGLPKVSIP